MSLSIRTPAFLPLPNLSHPLKLPSNPLFLTFHSQTHNLLCFSKGGNPNKPNKISDADLASDFASEVNKLNTQSEERENAMMRSKQLLFSDLCNYLQMNPEDVRNKWRSLSPDEKLGLVKGFVSDWGLNFHPLSPKSVQDLVEEFVVKDTKEKENPEIRQKDEDVKSSSDVFLPTLKRLIMGFSPNN
ncbi:hypothetical protein SOVF_158720 [Spinacia oleracea]|uniref:DUF7026 domain-containing protein n=1 Tax=Spinacia oleracea TaxID=3562 RepID=A0A9R0IFR0_SPIOL|nr:uncharacterized protein LOC110788003 [Spinacia oleracea]KNA08879.1 hypothetical protein SOVF_158720 [Spinacia oleracea]